MADPKHDEGFKVVDRRLFTEEGELRKDAIEQEKREQEAASKAASAAKIRSDGGKNQAAAASAPARSAAGGEASVGEGGADPIAPSRSFQMLVDFLTRNAAAMMGGMADPQTGQAYVDLEGAREMIDMLDALREKTRGNLAKADEDLLIEVAGSLKLTYMEISKAAADAVAKKAGQKK